MAVLAICCQEWVAVVAVLVPLDQQFVTGHL
jgi:hypothetical protein